MRRMFQFARLFPVLLVLVMLGVAAAGCESLSTYEKSYKVLSGSKVTMETLGAAAKDLHRTGVLDDAQIAQAEEAYTAAQTVQKEFIALQSEAILSGDATKQEQAARLGVAYLSAATRFINLAIQFGLIKGNDPNIQTISG